MQNKRANADEEQDRSLCALFFYNKRQQEWLRRWEVDKWRGEKRYKSELRGGQ